MYTRCVVDESQSGKVRSAIQVWKRLELLAQVDALQTPHIGGRIAENALLESCPAAVGEVKIELVRGDSKRESGF